MSHGLISDPSFHVFLLDIDRDLAAAEHVLGCARCSGRLHVADYARRPRGGPGGLGRQHDRRFSFCCAVEGCRKRRTPASVRFLGRRIWLGMVVVLAATLQHGPSRYRVSQLRETLGVSERTLLRWRRFWREQFAACSFWTAARGCFATPVETTRLPASLLERFAGDERKRLLAALRFLEPISVGSARHGLAS